MRSIKRIIIHPHYDQHISDYDIALLEMEAPVFFNELLAKTLQEARVKIINQSVCSRLYDDLITSRMLCAGNLNGGIDAC
ncbi:Suppressor of tumorigenicity 14 protein, partial [Varanus komodoensis]